MEFDIQDFNVRGDEIVKWLEGEFASIRTGRATPMLLDLVAVESYGTKVPLQQVGSITTEDAKTLRISVWDHSQIKEVERGILEADLGVSVAADDAGVRVIFPDLTSERREQLLKLAKTKLEEARVSLRGARDDAMKHIENDLKSGALTEDDKFDLKEEVQQHTDKYNKALGDMYDRKEAEINQ